MRCIACRRVANVCIVPLASCTPPQVWEECAWLWTREEELKKCRNMRSGCLGEIDRGRKKEAGIQTPFERPPHRLFPGACRWASPLNTFPDPRFLLLLRSQDGKEKGMIPPWRSCWFPLASPAPSLSVPVRAYSISLHPLMMRKQDLSFQGVTACVRTSAFPMPAFPSKWRFQTLSRLPLPFFGTPCLQTWAQR